MSTKKKGLRNIAMPLMTILVGVICGLTISVFLDGVFGDVGFFPDLLIKLLILALTYYLQLIIHEAGHLVAGLLSGYSFSSFRAGSIMILKENGKLKIKRQSVAGTGGQCLMIPPKMIDENFPFVLYNLGGVLLNILTIPVFVFLAVFCLEIPFVYAFCVLMVLSAFVVAMTNGIPLKLGMINNDGSNVVELRRDKEARIAFYNQFMILDSLKNGTRLRDMSDEYFPMPSEQGMKNSISAGAAVLLENRLMDAHKFDEANKLIDKLLYMDSALIGLHKNLLITDKIFIEALNGSSENAQKLYLDKSYQAFAKQMKTTINVIRTDYVCALLCEKDKKKAEEHLARFEKFARTHPYAVDVESERELIALVWAFYCENESNKTKSAGV